MTQRLPRFLGPVRLLIRFGERIGPAQAPALWHYQDEPACACRYCRYRAEVLTPEALHALVNAALAVGVAA